MTSRTKRNDAELPALGFAPAEVAFRRVLEIDRTDLTALSNLGILLAKEGKLKEAVALLKEAFDRNQDIPSLGKNLARVQCIAGDEAAAHSTLTTALIYSPGVDDVRELLTTLRKCSPAGAK
jgi:Flp pilus assembly protein TadD